MDAHKGWGFDGTWIRHDLDLGTAGSSVSTAACRSGRRGRRLRRDDYASKTDPEAQLYRESMSDAFRMSYLGQVLMENRGGLPVSGP